MNYNLLDENWIPVLYHDGKVGRVGIIEALTRAGRIRHIAASNPMDRVAILRFLLALLYWCKGNPPDNMETASGESFPPDWFSKLDDNRDCFNLLGEGKRFYQCRAAQRHQAVTHLLQEIPTGNNFWHLRHSTDMKDGLCPACCAFGLLRLPLFSVSGLSGPGEPNLMAGINGRPPIYVVPLGKSLKETLLTNWLTYSTLGEPAWINPLISPTPNQDVPLLTGLTLLSRRVLLHDPVVNPGVCIGCGTRKTRVILECDFQTAGKQENDQWDDPHVVYLDNKSRKTLRAADLTAAKKFQMDRPWPDLLAQIKAKWGKTTSLLLIGFATDRAKNIDVWERTVDIPSIVSNPETVKSLIQQWKKEGSSIIRELKPENEKSPREYEEIKATLAAVRPHVESRVSAKAEDLLSGSQDAWEQATREYRPMMAAIARSLSPGFTTAAVQWRRQIERVAPNMRPKEKTAKKQRSRKGGDK